MIFAKKHEIETESEKSFVEIKPVSDVKRVEIWKFVFTIVV